MLYSKANDPNTFDVEAFEFKDAEEAKRCAKFLNELLADNEIDRAMTLMIDALAYREAAQEIKEKENARWGCEPIDYDREFEVIIRYLEKVEQELEANNE